MSVLRFSLFLDVAIISSQRYLVVLRLLFSALRYLHIRFCVGPQIITSLGHNDEPLTHNRNMFHSFCPNQSSVTRVVPVSDTFGHCTKKKRFPNTHQPAIVTPRFFPTCPILPISSSACCCIVKYVCHVSIPILASMHGNQVYTPSQRAITPTYTPYW